MQTDEPTSPMSDSVDDAVANCTHAQSDAATFAAAVLTLGAGVGRMVPLVVSAGKRMGERRAWVELGLCTVPAREPTECPPSARSFALFSIQGGELVDGSVALSADLPPLLGAAGSHAPTAEELEFRHDDPAALECPSTIEHGDAWLPAQRRARVWVPRAEASAQTPYQLLLGAVIRGHGGPYFVGREEVLHSWRVWGDVLAPSPAQQPVSAASEMGHDAGRALDQSSAPMRIYGAAQDLAFVWSPGGADRSAQIAWMRG